MTLILFVFYFFMIQSLTLGKQAPEVCNVVIEIPRESTIKYEVDKETGLVKVDRYMRSAVHYPENYGYYPQTLAEDGDPLDAFVLGETLFPGVLVEARTVGVIYMIDNGEKDEKIITVPASHHRYENVHDINDINKHELDRMVEFLKTYKNLQKKTVEITGIGNREEALALIRKFTIAA